MIVGLCLDSSGFVVTVNGDSGQSTDGHAQQEAANAKA